MQLDKTRIAVRERSLYEVLDLALKLCRVYARPLVIATLLGALPCAVFNFWLIGWMASTDYIEYATTWIPFRYCWTLGLLTFIEMPLATVFVTQFLGSAVFEERPSIVQVVRGVARGWGQLLWFVGVLRGPLLAWGLAVMIDDTAEYTGAEFFLIIVALGATLIRTVRPFMDEIVLLEKNPWRSPDPLAMTVSRRSNFLHSPSSGDVISRSLGTGWVYVLLSASLIGNFVFLMGVLTGDWRFSWFVVVALIPLALWLVAGYMAVVRFLNYLDLRIRQEGWEVELRLRAEAARLAGPTLAGTGVE